MKWLLFACFVAFTASWGLFRANLLRRRTKGFPYPPGPRWGGIMVYRLLRGQKPASLPWKLFYGMRRAHGA